MSDLKMSDVFNQLEYKSGRDIDTGELADTSGNWWATFNSKQAAMHAATAINSYDRNQELIAKQAEQTKLLELSIKEAVAMIGEISYLQEESIILTLSARASKAATAKG